MLLQFCDGRDFTGSCFPVQPGSELGGGSDVPGLFPDFFQGLFQGIFLWLDVVVQLRHDIDKVNFAPAPEVINCRFYIFSAKASH